MACHAFFSLLLLVPIAFFTLSFSFGEELLPTPRHVPHPLEAPVRIVWISPPKLLIESAGVLRCVVFGSDLRPGPHRQGQERHVGPLRDGAGRQGEEAHQDHAAGAQPRVEREVLLVSTASNGPSV